ncbi:MAG TPA: sulfur transferase domain-containing protein [Pyrinomonadaceae bacterium]|nr:sulfur transferase domain-containing protein [Pyrinomonadaceae bacterium]
MHRPSLSTPASYPSPLLRILLAAFAALLALSTSAVGQGAAAYPELPRFSQVSERLYRGGQPRRGGMSRLAGLGINTVVNLRGAGERTRADEAEAAALGLRYFNVPMPVWGRPEDGRARRVLEVIAAPESGRVFVHCKDGVDRTGTIVALYRITAEGWSAEAATAEAVSRGMRRVQVWMRDYIDDYHDRRAREAGAAALPYDDDDDDLGDRFGSYVRAGERVTSEVRKRARRALRRAPGTMNGILERVF